MKNGIFGLLMVGLGFGLVACSDDGGGSSSDPKSIADCYPAMYQQTKTINDNMTAKGAATLDTCGQKGEYLTTYLADNTNSANLKQASSDFKTLVSTDNWNSISKVACNIFKTAVLADVYGQLRGINNQIKECGTIVETNGTEEAKTSWNSAVNGLSSVEGWNSAMAAAIAADQSAQKTQSGN